ncbi:hypothetical protein ACIPSE_09115 [Streptomyces sp. NPDC090106]|uniref:hypothetical protein n=1 Tax=Streptomyces sp. NPDC090106 TaxID=3365946 RepID=UPI003821C4DB
MGVPSDLARTVARIDARLAPLVNRPVDISDPDWAEKLRAAPSPLDEAGVRAEAEGALGELLDLYGRGDPGTLTAVRRLLGAHRYFTGATGVQGGTAPEDFRRELLWLSARDQACDVRDELLLLDDLCRRARDARIDLTPLLQEAAELSSDEDRFGMGSLRFLLLLRAAG